MRKITFSIFIGLFAAACALGCSLASLPERPRASVDPEMYILVGEVVGHTEPISDPNNFRGEAVGLKVKPKETINFPRLPKDYVEVFLFGVDASCFPVAQQDVPPIGTRVRLALYPARLVAPTSGEHVRLESQVFGRFAIDKSMFGSSTTAGSVFDYKKELIPLVEKFSTSEMANQRKWFSDFLYIETSKDLLRLQKAQTEKERIEILERLTYCPGVDFLRLILSEFGKPILPGDSSLPGTLGRDLKEALRNPPRKLSKDERRLLEARYQLESTGALNIWK